MASSPTAKKELEALWLATFETWCHQLLYLRSVYPRDTFAPTRFLGISSCHACRHPGVVQYIHNTLQVVVPSLLTGSAKQVSLVVMKDCFTVSETFTLSLASLSSDDNNDEQVSFSDTLEDTERAARDLILSLLSLERLPRKRLTDEASFKITMLTADKVNSQHCPEMQRAVNEGTWYKPCSGEEDSNKINEKIQPVHYASFPSGKTLQMNLVVQTALEKDKDERGQHNEHD